MGRLTGARFRFFSLLPLARNRLTLVFFLLLSAFLLAQEPARPSGAQPPPEPSPQQLPAASEPASHTVSSDPAPETSSAADPEELALPRKARTFKFTKVDLELLRQVNAFDNYMQEKGWVYDDPEINAYLEKLGRSLVPTETPENVKWRFRTVRDLEVNAFALPNGSIYVNSGLVSRLANEAQLAGVLAYEITHVINRYSYLENRSSRNTKIGIEVIVAGAWAGSPIYFPWANYAIVSTMAKMMPTITVGTIFGLDRELEHEADVQAVHALFLRKYDLREFSRGLELLGSGPEVDLGEHPAFWASPRQLAGRVRYITKMAARLQPNATGLRVNQTAYRSATVNTIRHNASLAILLGSPRTAVAIAQRLIVDEPHNAENFVLLGDAYRSLGARTPVPDSDELTDQHKNEARERLRKMTITEYDQALLADPHGPEHWQGNAIRAEEAFRKALAMDPQNATAHRGLGFLYERNGANMDAIEQFKKYRELAPGAKDARQISLHIESLQKLSSAQEVVSRQPVQVHKEK